MIGKTISHYQIVEKLGAGGMGTVYKAQDTKLDRFVALKFLPPEFTRDEEAQKRFIHEARAASTLDHPNIGTIYEIGESDGQSFIAMAYYEGETLKHKIERGPLDVQDVLEYAIQMAQGLRKAHSKDIIHRDIKPSNILITEEGQIKIIDFGVAKLKGRTILTKTGTTMGTFAYMSPEQGRGEEVDARTDIWSLGIILYEMLTGQQPFKGDYEQAVIYSIMNEDPEPITKLRGDVPKGLEKIVNKALAKDPGERYQRAEEMLVDLRAVAEKLESGTPKQKLAKATPHMRRRKILYGAIVVFVLLVLGAGIYFQMLREKESDKGIAAGEKTAKSSVSQWENSIAVSPFKNISPDQEQEYFCDGMTEQIITNLSQLEDLKVIARTSVMKFKDTEKTIPEIAAELDVAHILTGSIRKSGNHIRVSAQLIQAADGHHIWANDYDRELQDIFGVQDDVSEAIARALLRKLTSKEAEELKTKGTESVEAYEYYLKGEYFHDKKFMLTGRMADFKRSEEMFEKAIALDPNYALAYAGLADLYNTYTFKNMEVDKKYIDLQRNYIETAFRLDPNSPSVNRIKGHVHSYYGETSEEFESKKRALELNPNNSSNNLAMGSFLYGCGLHHQAIDFFEKAVELNPLDVHSYTWLGGTLRLIGNFEEAMTSYQKALEIESDNILTLYYLARLLIILKEYKEAEEHLKKMKQINPASQSNNIISAFLYAVKGQKRMALQSLEQGRPTNRYDKVVVYCLLGLKGEALRVLDRRPMAPLPDVNREESDYLDMVNNPLFDILRNTDEFKVALQKAKEIYDQNLRKYGEVVQNLSKNY